MKTTLLYGKNGITIDLPDEINATEINKHPMPLLADVESAIYQSFLKPLNSPSLSELADGKETVCILICDITRPVPHGKILPPLVDQLLKAGIQKENILILVATGLHRPNEGEELRELIDNDYIFSNFRIENHFARDRQSHVDLGHTSQGIPIGIDCRFYEADLRLVTGLVEPHFMAGYSGGRKVVAPGVAYMDTILNFHAAHILEHEKSANCIMEGNPLHEAQMEIIKKVGPIFGLNVVIDDKRRIGQVTFGDIEASHLAAVNFMKDYAEVSVKQKFKTIVTSAGGYPLDKTFYQTIKGMVGAMDILEPGGTIIIASECSEGMGSPEFVAAQKLLCQNGHQKFMEMLWERKKARIDEWQTEMLLKPLRQGKIYLYSNNLTDEELGQTYVGAVSSIEKGIRESLQKHGNKEIAVIPEGPYVVPRYQAG